MACSDESLMKVSGVLLPHREAILSINNMLGVSFKVLFPFPVVREVAQDILLIIATTAIASVLP